MLLINPLMLFNSLSLCKLLLFAKAHLYRNKPLILLGLLLLLFFTPFTRAAVPVGDEFQVNTYTTDWQSHPSVSNHCKWRFCYNLDEYRARW